MTMLAAIRETILDEMARDERVVLLGEDVGANGGVFRATDGALERFGPSRVFDMPIAESVIVGASVGLSVAGLVPLAEIQFGGFTMQAYHQLVGQLARLRYRSRGRFHCPGHRARALRRRRAHARAPRRLGRGAVHAHARAHRGRAVERRRRQGAAGQRDPQRRPGARLRADPVLPHGGRRPRRRARRSPRSAPTSCATGDDAVVITWGAMVDVALAASDAALEARGAEVGVVDLRTLTPLDTETIVHAAERAGRVVVVHEAPLTAGFGAEVVATIQEEAFYSLEAPIRRVAGYDVGSPPPLVEDWCRPDVARVVAALDASLDA